MSRFDYPFTPKKFAVDGHSLSYLDEGKGPVLVMVHGNPTWSFFYRNLVVALRDKYRVIVPDHIGCGLSDKPQDYTYRLENHVDNLEKLLTHLKIDKLSMIMHDWGGAIAMGYAVRHKDQIQSLTVMNTAAFRSKRIPKRIRICRAPWLGDFMVRGLNVFSRAALHMAVKKRMPRKVKRAYLAPYRGWRNRVAVLRFVQDIPLTFTHPSWETLIKIESEIGDLADKPMLIMWGGRDFCFNKDFFDEWKVRFPQARSIYFESAGHYLLEDVGDEVEQYLKTFLRDFVLHKK